MPSIMQKAKVEQIEELLATGIDHKQVAKLFHVHVTTIVKISTGQHFHQQTVEEQLRRSGKVTGRPWRAPSYEPSPEEIEQKCKEIRATWCNEDGDPCGWTPPEYSMRQLVGVCI